MTENRNGSDAVMTHISSGNRQEDEGVSERSTSAKTRKEIKISFQKKNALVSSVKNANPLKNFYSRANDR